MSSQLSLEWIIPEQMLAEGGSSEKSVGLHLERYRWVAERLKGEHVLDMACGVGYGCQLLVDTCPQVSKVVGVDIDPSALSYAKYHYRDNKISYTLGDVCSYRYCSPVDAVVSLETIEHVQNPEVLLENLGHNLRIGGQLFASVPVTPSMDGNPHHLSDFTLRSFRKLLARHGFVEKDILIQIQPFEGAAVREGGDARVRSLPENLLNSYMKKPWLIGRRLRSLVKDGLVNKYALIHGVKGPLSE